MKGEVVAVVLLLLTVYSCQAENVIVGSTKNLVCQFPNGNRWEKFSDGTTFWEIINNGGRYSGAYSNNLTITKFQIEDSGYFRCKIDGTVSTGNTIELNPEVRSTIGSSFTLTCTVSGAPLYWYKIGNNGPQTLKDGYEYEGSRNSSLTIKYFTTNIATVHYCQLTSGTKGPDITVSIVVAGWSSWNEWNVCSASCGNGQRQRSRTCSESCTGSAVENENCTVDYGADGSWSIWSISGDCTGSCGDGSQQRRRFCNNPPPEHCGKNCIGEDNDNIPCSLSPCPVNGGWSSWTSGPCNGTCGTGQQSRRRYCNNPLKANGGADCQGKETDFILCALSACAGDYK